MILATFKNFFFLSEKINFENYALSSYSSHM